MNPPPSTNRPRSSRRAWVLTLIFAVAAAVAALALWLVIERQQSHLRMIELQQIEIQSLQAALESESLISQGSLQQLRSVAAGRFFSAHAILQATETPPPRAPITALWSDDLAAGFMLLPSNLTPAQKNGLEILIIGESESRALQMPTESTDSDQIIGFKQSADRERPIRIILRLPLPGSDSRFESFQADWIR